MELTRPSAVGQPAVCEPWLPLQWGASPLEDGGPVVQDVSLATKSLLKSPHTWSKTVVRTCMKEQGMLCVATAAETSAAMAEATAPPLAASGNKDVPLSVNLSLLLRDKKSYR